ncbi:MAG: hypothetical protein GY810_14590 [Aureispira sp.]|nr:hypothetical protein [Aureispira sp.]
MRVKSKQIAGLGTAIKKITEHQSFGEILKVGVAVALIVVLCLQMFGAKEINLQVLTAQFLEQLTFSNLYLVVLVLLLMPLNWAIENLKWLKLMQPVERVGFLKGLKAIFAGVTFSLFTPNRIGEYGGRVLLVSKDNRLNAVLATLVGSFSQWIVLVVSGFVGLLSFLLYQDIVSNFVFWSIAVGSTAFSIGLFIAYFRIQRLVERATQWKWTKKWALKVHENVFRYYTRHELLMALGYAFLRYLTYTFQYLLLLQFFGLGLTIPEGLMAISIIFLIQTGIPLPPSTGLLARGNVALFIFGLFISSSLLIDTAILASTFSLWLINVALPAVVGALFIFKIGTKKTIETTHQNTPSKI